VEILDKLRVAVIGVGIQGENHVKAYKTHPRVDLVAVCDINEERARAVAEKYGIGSIYRDYREMLGKEDLDLVSIATPDHLHLNPVLATVESGVNALIEKPMATSYQDALKMVKAAKKKGVKVYVNFANRFNPPFAITKKRFTAGELGKPLYAYLRLSDTIYVPTKMLSWASKTNVVFFLMSHTADLATWIFNSNVRRVRAFAHFEVLESLGIEVPDYVVAVLEFENGGRAVLESSWILPETLPSVVDFVAEFLGTKGAVYISTTRQTIEVASVESHEYPKPLNIEEVNNRLIGFVKESIHHFVDAFLEKREPIVNMEDGPRNVRILESIVKSFKEDRVIELS